MIDITGLAKAAVLAALFNASKQQGVSFVATPSRNFNISEATAEDIIRVRLAGAALNYDYLRGRVLKVDISGDCFEEYLFDRDNGVGAAERAITPLRPEQAFDAVSEPA